MSHVFDSLGHAMYLLEGPEEVKLYMRWTIQALHDISHQHEDWLNRDSRLSNALRRLDNALRQCDPEREP
jgi:hypothetical protein